MGLFNPKVVAIQAIIYPDGKPPFLDFESHNDIYAEGMKICRRIQSLRLQMLIHSRIYYRLGESLISDDEFNQRAQELKQLQNEYPMASQSVLAYYAIFKDWEGSTGMDLPLEDPWVVRKVDQLLHHGQKQINHKEIKLKTGKADSKADKGKTATKQWRNKLF